MNSMKAVCNDHFRFSLYNDKIRKSINDNKFIINKCNVKQALLIPNSPPPLLGMALFFVFPTNAVLFSFDVVGLFPNVPLPSTVECMRGILSGAGVSLAVSLTNLLVCFRCVSFPMCYTTRNSQISMSGTQILD